MIVHGPETSTTGTGPGTGTGAAAGARGPGAGADARGRAARAGTRARRPDGGRPRLRPRRIPGAPGAVLLRATLSDAVDGRDARRLRRRPTGKTPVTTEALAPDDMAPEVAAPDDMAPEVPAPDEMAPEVAAPDAATSEDAAPPARPVLRPVTGTAQPAGARPGRATSRRARDRRKGRGTSASRASRGPAPSRPGERPPQRVLRAFSALNFDRLVPADDAARERRAAQFRRVGITVASAALVVLMIYSVFPVRTWINQRDAADRAREQLAAFERENDMLAEEARELREDERIEVLAREMGMVRPGEELYGILPAPEPPSPAPDVTSTTPSDG